MVDFPALAVSIDDSFSVIEELPRSATSTALRSYFSESYIFDTTGRRWPVQHVEASPSLLDRLLNRRVAIRVGLGKPSAVALADVVDDLCALVDADPDDLYCQFVSAAELKKLFRDASTPAELIAVARSLGEP